MSASEFKRLRERARTAEDFRRLATWCRWKAAFYRKDEADCEAELRRHPQPSPHPQPKHPTRGQTLRTLALHYHELSSHWTELADIFTNKALEVGAHIPR
jgi:hypothetical protein